MTTHSLKDLEQNDRLQWSYYELQTRVSKLGEINSGWASRSGKRGKWLVSDAGLEVLAQLRELEQNGSSVDSALEVLQQETTGAGDDSQRTPEQEHLTKLHEESRNVLLDRISLLQGRVLDLQAERDRLLGLLENLTLALPPGRQAEEEKRQGFHWPWRR